MKKIAEQQPLTFSKDQYGKEILLKDGKLQVMMEWEKPYMEACVAALKPNGEVLEVGFGLGYSADAIQLFNPKSHTIIECDPEVMKKAREWAKDKSNVHLIEGMWQEVLDDLGHFDQIFFDDYAPPGLEESEKLNQQAKTFSERTEQFNEIIDFLSEQLNRYRDVKFSDSDLQDFLIFLNTRADISSTDVSQFVDQLEAQGNISEAQKASFNGQFAKQSHTHHQSHSLSLPSYQDRLFVFIDQCILHHMNPGSRICSYIDYHEYLKREEAFTEAFLSHPKIGYNKQIIDVEVPPNCEYYKGSKALILVLEKK